MNIHRRHLNESQRAKIAEKMATMKAGGDRKSDQTVNSQFDSTVQTKMTLIIKRSVNHHRAGKPVTITGTVRVEINEKQIADMIAAKALQNSAGKATLLGGELKATVLAWEHES
jgi:hypothetical protein